MTIFQGIENSIWLTACESKKENPGKNLVMALLPSLPWL